MITFLAELNGLEMWCTDVGSTYLEAKTKEKVYIVGGPEFKELEGHVLIIYKALYGLRFSGKMWLARFADCLREMGFFPCKMEPNIWIRKNGNLYEYIAVYVNDLAIAAMSPKETIQMLQEKYKFKLKGSGPISFHLGCDYF